jgi:hypothetical protein
VRVTVTARVLSFHIMMMIFEIVVSQIKKCNNSTEYITIFKSVWYVLYILLQHLTICKNT